MFTVSACSVSSKITEEAYKNKNLTFYHTTPTISSNVILWSLPRCFKPHLHLASRNHKSSHDDGVRQCGARFHTLTPMMAMTHAFLHILAHIMMTHMINSGSVTIRITSKRPSLGVKYLGVFWELKRLEELKHRNELKRCQAAFCSSTQYYCNKCNFIWWCHNIKPQECQT